jgi:Protein of unknown function (DUF3617)
MKSRLSAVHRTIARAALALTALGLAVPAAGADGIDPGLWKIITRTESAGAAGPPHESSKCLTAEETQDLGTTFSPVPQTINSVCAPIERSLEGPRLTWHLVCKGQLDMELSGEFNFDTSHHYTATVRTRAAMAGMQMIDSQNMLEGRWVSACPQ